MKIQMPIYTTAKCTECDAVDQYAFGLYGSESPCYTCDAAPVQLVELEKVGA